jgi:hypothetical protein
MGHLNSKTFFLHEFIEKNLIRRRHYTPSLIFRLFIRDTIPLIKFLYGAFLGARDEISFKKSNAMFVQNFVTFHNCYYVIQSNLGQSRLESSGTEGIVSKS